MKIKVMTEIELVLLRNWMCEIYNAGRGFIGITPHQLVKIRKKLEELDAELLERVLKDDEALISFSDENFEETVKQVQTGKFDGESK